MLAIRQRRVIAILAGLAMLFAALAPALAQTVAERSIGKHGWTELCTGYGRKVVRIEMGKPVPAGQLEDANKHFERCPFCPLNTACLPPAAETAIHAEGSARRAPRLFHQVSAPLFAWHGAQPRGPPRLS